MRCWSRRRRWTIFRFRLRPVSADVERQFLSGEGGSTVRKCEGVDVGSILSSSDVATGWSSRCRFVFTKVFESWGLERNEKNISSSSISSAELPTDKFGKRNDDWREVFEIGNAVALIWLVLFEGVSTELDEEFGEAFEVNNDIKSASRSLIKGYFS